MKKQQPGPWTPTWEEVAGAAHNIARRNLWRVRPLYDMEDLMSDAYLVFLRLVRRYPCVIEPPHFMSLYLSSWSRTLHSMATRRSRSASGHVTAGGFRQTADERYDPIANASTLCPTWQQTELFWRRAANASPAILALLEGLDRKGRPRRCARSFTGHRQTTNEFLARIAQLDPQAYDLRAELKTFLEGASV